MRLVYLGLTTAAAALLVQGPAGAQAGNVSFSKDLVPILKESCVKCHSTRQPQGGFAVSSFALIEKGGKGGKSLAPKPEDSRLIKYLEGTLKPKMPIGGSLTKPQIDKFKAWIAQGSKSDVDVNALVIPDSAIPEIKVPVIKLKVPILPQAASLAWSKDNKVLAVGTYKTVRLVDPSTGQTVRELAGHADVIHNLQFSPDGKLLAAAGGPASLQGELKIWDVATGALVKTIVGHTDFIYSCAWSPDNKNIATASYDKLVKIWDVTSGAEVKTLKDHADAVYGVAYNPAGNLLASASADRSVKVWDVATGKRIYTLTGHGDIVFSVAWSPAGNQLCSVGADKTLRVWNVNAQNGNQAQNTGAHGKSVNEVAYSPDGSMMATASDDKTVKIWKPGNGSPIQTIKDLPDAMLSVAFSPDNKLVAAGGFDGSVKIYVVADGKLQSTIIDLPKPPEPKVDPAKPKTEAPKPADPKAAPAKK